MSYGKTRGGHLADASSEEALKKKESDQSMMLWVHYNARNADAEKLVVGALKAVSANMCNLEEPRIDVPIYAFSRPRLKTPIPDNEPRRLYCLEVYNTLDGWEKHLTTEENDASQIVMRPHVNGGVCCAAINPFYESDQVLAVVRQIFGAEPQNTLVGNTFNTGAVVNSKTKGKSDMWRPTQSTVFLQFFFEPRDGNTDALIEALKPLIPDVTPLGPYMSMIVRNWAHRGWYTVPSVIKEEEDRNLARLKLPPSSRFSDKAVVLQFATCAPGEMYNALFPRTVLRTIDRKSVV